jgi:hypothetical protein
MCRDGSLDTPAYFRRQTRGVVVRGDDRYITGTYDRRLSPVVFPLFLFPFSLAFSYTGYASPWLRIRIHYHYYHYYHYYYCYYCYC